MRKDRIVEITEENIFELAVWTMAELAVGIAIAIHQEIISVIAMLLIMGFLFCRCLSNCFDFGKQRRTKYSIFNKSRMIIEKYNIWCVW